VDNEHPQHEKIRFRRGEIADLGSLPSACQVPPLGRAKVGRRARILRRMLAALAAVTLLLVAAVYAFNWSGIGSARLQVEAEKAIEALAGVDVAVAVGPARISLGGSSFLSLRVDNVNIKDAGGRPVLDAGRIRFGVRLIPLLAGQVRLSSAKISEARIVAMELPSAGKGDWAEGLRNEQGLVDPDLVGDAVFAAIHQALDAVRGDFIREISLADVDIELPQTGQVKLVRIAKATVRQAGPGQLRLSAQADIDGRALTVTASASRDDAVRRVSGLELDARLEAAAAGSGTPGANGSRLGSLTVHLTGTQGNGESASRLAASLSLDSFALDFGSRGPLSGNVAVDATLVTGTNKISLDRLQVAAGRSTFDFQGSIGPRPPAGTAGDEPAYRYDLVSDGSTLAPVDSPEPAMKFIARIAGVYTTNSQRLLADTIAVKSALEGEVLGKASIEFVDGKEPGVSLALNVHDMPVSHVKQLWPWFAAGNARNWVLKNLFGGRVADGNLQFQVAPGRLGNGVPLSASEVFGRFQVENSRFDTAGHIPPVRDANGIVEFHGDDVAISLSSGTVYMPSGRTVAASNGTLEIRNARRSPVIGVLDLDVAGDAPAIVELASYEPIDAMRHIGLLPEELSGTVTGNVKADIPLQSGTDTSKLGWLVALDYSDLALAKPFDGQMVAGADGSITVDPQKAVIDAHALLNGLPAEVDMVEPLGPQGPPRSRKVTLVLDDKTREAFMPELSMLLGGTVKVALDRNDDGSQAVKADLTNARLDIPWAGWSKGPGVPASVAFTMTRLDNSTRLTDFDLKGKSFSIDGSVELSGGSLSSARFTRVALNRGDDVAVSVKRSSKGYAVNVSGNALDARALIKQFLSDAETATKSVGAASVSVSADVKALSGFHDEKLSNLALEYSAMGSRVNGLTVSAAASSGAAITISNTSGGGARELDVKSADAGAILRFLDVYEHMQGGAISLTLAGGDTGPMTGRVVARDFLIVNEPKLASIVSTTPAGDSRSLNQAVKGNIDTSQVKFERGAAEIVKDSNTLRLANGVLRGPLIGTTFQGTLYDENDHMDMTGTFMPAYGLNRIFGELPIIGALLGNGRDRGLIGVTYRLTGKASKPDLEINPLSVIAPGIFRSIFEYR
jgi:hypothetical protein